MEIRDNQDCREKEYIYQVVSLLYMLYKDISVSIKDNLRNKRHSTKTFQVIISFCYLLANFKTIFVPHRG